MQPSGHMYLLNPENGNLVNTQTGKDIEIISWEDLVEDVKKIVIGIDGRMIYSPGVENAIIPFQEWMAKEHPEVEVSLHSGPVRNVMILDETVVVVEAHAYGMSVVTARAQGGKLGKMAKFIQMDDPDFNRELNLEVTKDENGNLTSIKESPCSSKAMNIPLGKAEVMSEQEKDKLCKDISGTMEDILQQRREGKDIGSSELIKSGVPLINQHFTAGISPGRFYMMGAYTSENKSMLITADELNYQLNKNIGFNGRPMKVFIGFNNLENSKDNIAAALELGKEIHNVVGSNWIGVDDVKDADVGLVFKDNWWHIVKARGCHELMGKRLITKKRLMDEAKDVNVEDAYPKVDNAQLPKASTPTSERVNTYNVDWNEADHGILIIVDIQKNMSSVDAELNREMLGRLTDSIFSKNLNQHVLIKGDTDGDYETRLAETINDVSCVVNICGGEAEIEKFIELPSLVGSEVW